MKNYIIRAINKNKTMRIFVANTTNLVKDIKNIFNASNTATAAMGRLATISLIMGLTTKNPKEKLTIIFDGKGAGGKLISVANANGEVKVTATHPQADVERKYAGKLDVGAYVGTDGNVSIIRDYGLKEPYTGVSKIVTGEIAEDIASYYFHSEQTPSVLSLGVYLNPKDEVEAAGGIFIQVLPSISEEELNLLEDLVGKLKPISTMIRDGLSPEDILSTYFSKLESEIIETKEVFYKCECSRERIETGMVSIGKEDLTKIIEEDGEAEIICDFCKTRYHFSKEDLLKMLEVSK